MNFKEATDALFEQATHEDLANILNVSVALIRQARLSSLASAYRSPPRGWELAVLKLSERRASHYEKLADRIRTALESKQRRPTAEE